MSVSTPDRDLNKLESKFRRKVEFFLAEAKRKGHAIMMFEGRRSKARQERLYAQWRTRPGKIVTRTLNSRHLTGQAVDIVFVVNGQPSRKGNYDALITIGKQFQLRNLKPLETAHFEDNGIPLNSSSPPPVITPPVLTPAQALMIYKQLFQTENPQWSSIFRDPEAAIARCFDNSGNFKPTEFYYLMLVGMERLNRQTRAFTEQKLQELKTQMPSDDSRLADALRMLMENPLE